MRVGSSPRRRLAVGLALAACSLAIVMPAAADARIIRESQADESAPAVQVQPTVLPVVDHGSQTLAIVFSSTALFLASGAVVFTAVYRRRRPRWSAS